MRRIYPLIFFAAVTVLAFWKVIFHADFTLLSGGDVAAAYYPWFDVAAYWLKKGIFLLWDPYVYAGKVTMGEPQPGLFYPLNWIFMLLPSPGGGVSVDGLQTLVILDYFLASYFFYLLARSLNLAPSGSAVAGIGFAIGGYTAQIYGYVNVLSGFVWLPLAFLFYRKALLADVAQARIRWALLSGLVLAASFLPGHHIPPVHIGLLLLLYSIFLLLSDWRKSTWKARIGVATTLAAVAVTSAALTTLQWLPSAEWARYVYRWVGEGDPVKWGEKVPYMILQHSSNVSPQDVISLVLPYVSVNATLYVGPALLFLALVGILFVRDRDAVFFTIALVCYLFLSWGVFSAVHGWFNSFIPGLWFAREVFYYLIPFQACLALLAGWGLDYLVSAYSGSLEGPFRTLVRRAGWTMAFLALLFGVVAAAGHLYRELPMDHPNITRSMGLATYLAVLGLLLFLLHIGRIRPTLFRSLVVALIVVDLSSHLSGDIRTKATPAGQSSTYVRAYWKQNSIAEQLKEKRREEFFRVDDPSFILPTNFGDVWRLESTMGHGATALVDYFAFRGTGWGPGSNATALLNARYIVSRIPVPGMKKVFGDREAVYVNPRAVPRAFALSRYRSVAKREEVLSWIMSPLFAPRQTLLVVDEDLAKLPREFLESVRNERENIQVIPASYRTSAEKEAEKTKDEEIRHRLNVFRAPWGWSVGDELTLLIRPDKLLAQCYLVFTYYPTTENPSRLALRVERAGRVTELPVVLPGLRPGEAEPESPVEAAVDLGSLPTEECRVSFQKTEECSAKIDSLRVSSFPPDPGSEDSGAVKVTSFRPNRLRVLAELKRPAFVVVSEVNYPGWEAFVDGKPFPLLSGDYILRAVPVPAGKHEIVFRFRSRTFEWGLVVSVASLLLIGVFLAIRR